MTIKKKHAARKPQALIMRGLRRPKVLHSWRTKWTSNPPRPMKKGSSRGTEPSPIPRAWRHRLHARRRSRLLLSRPLLTKEMAMIWRISTLSNSRCCCSRRKGKLGSRHCVKISQHHRRCRPAPFPVNSPSSSNKDLSSLEDHVD